MKNKYFHLRYSLTRGGKTITGAVRQLNVLPPPPEEDTPDVERHARTVYAQTGEEYIWLHWDDDKGVIQFLFFTRYLATVEGSAWAHDAPDVKDLFRIVPGLKGFEVQIPVPLEEALYKEARAYVGK